MTDLNRREILKAGAIGAVFGFLFRGRGGALQEEPVEPEQLPAAAEITCAPQRAFRPERLVVMGTVIGRQLVPETRFEPCEACEKPRLVRRWWSGVDHDAAERARAERGDDDDTYCETCDDLGGKMVETGKMVERDVTHVPWIIEDIAINRQSQFVAGEGIPGDMFAAGAVDSFVSMDSAGPGGEIKFRVRYVGDKPGGERFRAALIGTEVDGSGRSRMLVLPIDSGVEIAA